MLRPCPFVFVFVLVLPNGRMLVLDSEKVDGDLRAPSGSNLHLVIRFGPQISEIGEKAEIADVARNAETVAFPERGTRPWSAAQKCAERAPSGDGLR